MRAQRKSDGENHNNNDEIGGVISSILNRNSNYMTFTVSRLIELINA